MDTDNEAGRWQASLKNMPNVPSENLRILDRALLNLLTDYEMIISDFPC